MESNCAPDRNRTLGNFRGSGSHSRADEATLKKYNTTISHLKLARLRD